MSFMDCRVVEDKDGNEYVQIPDPDGVHAEFVHDERIPGLIAGSELVHIEGLEDEVARLRDALTVLRDACGHCIAARHPPTRQMIEGADAALRGYEENAAA